jgi:glycosyltransferase involved in cell wall biosynthesis
VGHWGGMRIVLVTHKVDFQDGQGRVNYEVVQGALAAGHHVTVVGERCSQEIASHPLATFIPMGNPKLPTRILKDLWFARESAEWLRQHRGEFDVVQANGFVTWEPTDVVAVHFVHSAWIKNEAYPFRWSSLSPYAYYQRLYTILNARFERRAFKSAKRVIAVSSFTAGEIAALGIQAERISVVYNGVDTEEFRPGESERESFGLPDGVPLLFFVGDIRTKRKNLEAVLHAMQSFPEAHLAVAGKVEGSPYPVMAQELKVSGRVHFLGTTSRVAALMRSCDVFVFPSRYEAQPLVLLEALGSGLPVVVSNNFRAQDYIGDGGIVYGEADDLAALTAALETVLRSPAKRDAMKEAARMRALEMQWSKTAAGYLAVYDELVAER